MRSGERARTSLHNGVPWAVDWVCVSSMAWGWISEVATVVWVLDVAQVVVFRPFGSGVVALVDGDVVVVLGGSDCKGRGCGASRGVVDQLGAVCRRFRVAGGGFEAGGELVVVVDDRVVVVDGSCAAVVTGDVAALARDGGLVTQAVGAGGSVSVWVAILLVLGVVWALRSTQSVVSAFFVRVGFSSSGGSVWRAAHQRSGLLLVWEAVSVVVGGVGVV